MKIPSSLESTYNALRHEVYEPLQERVDHIIQQVRDPAWHYCGRIKALESFVQKLETGRYPSAFLEDFFACTLVVENATRIDDAVGCVRDYCSVEYQRPEQRARTHKTPDAFPFDDLRLYVKLLPRAGDHAQLSPYIFEVQIKTFLQHAWSIAAHDLIYKTDKVDWSEERIAYQIKATLEHLDLSLRKEAIAAKRDCVSCTDNSSEDLQHLIELLRETWQAESLPKDLGRLARTINSILKGTGLAIADLAGIMRREEELGRGARLLNLSPYSSILSALFRHEQEKLLNALNAHKFRLFLVKDLDIEDSLLTQIQNNVICESGIEYRS
jgi:hypothetical protein